MNKKNVRYFCMPVMLGVFCAIFSACGSTPASTNSTSGGMDLDAAIKEAAAQMEAKIPPRTMVALVSVASPSMAFSTQVLTRLESAIVSSGKLVVVDRANLDQIREEQGFQLSGEVDDESAKSIGKLLGAGAIVTGTLADLGDIYSLTLKAINIETATVAVSYLADLAKTTRIETLLAARDGAAGTQTAQRGSAGGGTTAQTAAKTYKIGDIGPAGGIVFFDKFSKAGGWQYLEAAPKETEQSFPWGKFWAVYNTKIDIGAGMDNTELILAAAKKEGVFVTAAQFCGDLEYGGYDDWFLPSRDELNLMYENLKAQGLGDFTGDIYWSSTDIYHCSNAMAQRFSNGVKEDREYYGGGGPNDNSLSNKVRAIRRF